MPVVAGPVVVAAATDVQHSCDYIYVRTVCMLSAYSVRRGREVLGCVGDHACTAGLLHSVCDQILSL